MDAKAVYYFLQLHFLPIQTFPVDLPPLPTGLQRFEKK